MPEHRHYRYRITQSDGHCHAIDVVIDGATLECTAPAPAARPWTALAHHRCPHCPLPAAGEALCPLAARLAPVVDALGAVRSYDEVDVAVEGCGRTVSAHVSAQAAASSLMGLIGATSGCPHTRFLKPLAWFHQPFADTEETVFRAIAAWLVAARVHDPDGLPAEDWLKARYAAVQRLNVHVARRLRDACPADAAVNAVVRLDMFAKAIPDEIDRALDALRTRFRPDPGAPA